mmetsp:Transcript_38363/g.81871  ORF Transcript_38363/g.81871 Transcript_38363/m.81871 type:complete len:445 (-) Transcript_38363:78-1412(-)
MLPRSWFTHAASFCVGAATAAAVLIQSSLTVSRDNSDKSIDSGNRIITSDLDYGENNKEVPLRALAARGSVSSIECSIESMQAMIPTLPVRFFHPNDKLVIAFDTRNKNPLFSMERLTERSPSREEDASEGEAFVRDRKAAASRKNKRFREESFLLPYHRSRNHHYRNSGYDRGHLAPAADFSSSDDDMDDTFVLSNVSPQLPRFNRSVWLRLEEFVRRVAKSEGSKPSIETWVVTGPLWLPSLAANADSGDDGNFLFSYRGIGNPPSLVSVPTHFFKVLVVVDRKMTDEQSQSTKSRDSTSSGGNSEATLKKFAAFVLPNSNSIGGNSGIRLIDFAVRLTDLEAASGLEFFPALFGEYVDNLDSATSVPLQKKVADALTDDIRSEQKVTTISSMVPLSNGEKLSKGRHRKMKQLLHENTPVPFSFQHLCRKNEACFKFLNVQQ